MLKLQSSGRGNARLRRFSARFALNLGQEAFKENINISNKVGELVAEIAAASNEQAQGIEQVNRAVAEMDKVVQRVAANSEESASASEEMNAQAEQMKEFVERLIAVIGGNQTHAKDDPARTEIRPRSDSKKSNQTVAWDQKLTPASVTRIIPTADEDV